MTLPHFHVGCDISRDIIDVFDASTGRFSRIANTATALQAWLRTYDDRPARFVFEATGPYGVPLRRALLEAGMTGIEINPMRARRFAQAAGIAAKTDRVDARLLAMMADRLELQPTPSFQSARHALKSLITRRDQLVAMGADERKRLLQCHDDGVRESLRRILAVLDDELQTVSRAIEAALAADPAMARDRHLLMSIPGIGPVTAAVLLTMMPELGSASPKAVASLAGCAPHADDSGKRSGKRHVRGGRPRVLRALYMAALSASRRNSRFGEKYRRMRNDPLAPKAAKVALIAIARKIIVTANALIRDQTAFA